MPSPDRTRFPTLLLLLPLLAGCIAAGDDTSVRVPGGVVALGAGDVESYAEVDAAGAPRALGVSFSAGALERLPETPSDMNRCYDADGDGALDAATECSMWHERVLPLPTEVSRRADVPFKWVLLNWNNHGHIPPGVYDVPHFDVHFYIAPIEDVMALQRGTCGPELLRCDQFERARRPVPAALMHPKHVDVGAAAPAMGNHLIDTTAVEFRGEPFTRAWIYGAYDGAVIFYEEMVALDWLRSRPDACEPIPATPEVAVAGWYPTMVCTRHDAASGRTTVSLESFIRREAAAPAPT